MPFRFVFRLSDGETISLKILPEDVSHLMGVRKLHLRQAQNSSAKVIYDHLKSGVITLDHFVGHKEEYKKAVNFPALISILYCGETVRVVKKIGSLNSSYLFYLDHSPDEIIHLGVKRDKRGAWHTETLLVINKRGLDAYIRNQIPVVIEEMQVQET